MRNRGWLVHREGGLSGRGSASHTSNRFERPLSPSTLPRDAGSALHGRKRYTLNTIADGILSIKISRLLILLGNPRRFRPGGNSHRHSCVPSELGGHSLPWTRHKSRRLAEASRATSLGLCVGPRACVERLPVLGAAIWDREGRHLHSIPGVRCSRLDNWMLPGSGGDRNAGWCETLPIAIAF